ncbi:MAG: TRAP transporter substrate-binding protein [Gammaproteobacteria bacterium]|nr:TRAP transporter substrate-binding protein [Gammaproteobacteria bacterium]
MVDCRSGADERHLILGGTMNSGAKTIDCGAGKGAIRMEFASIPRFSLSRILPRMRFLLPLLGLLLSACEGGGGPETGAEDGQSRQSFRWRMVTTWPAGFPIFQEGAEKFAEDVAVMSDGRLQIQVFAGGELVPALEVFDAVSQGVVEMGHGASYYWAGKVPAAQFFSTVPFGMSADDMRAWLYGGGGLEIWRRLYARFGIVPFPMGNTGLQMGGWFKRRIDSIDDLRGLRMRIPGLGGRVLKSAGGAPVLIAAGELYTALERGVIDAAEWVGPFHDMRLGLHRAAKYYYYPGWHEPGTEFELLVGTAAWERLPKDLQKIVAVAATAAGNWLYAQMETRNRQALQEIKEHQRVQILAFPPSVLAELRKLTQATLDEEAGRDAEFKEVYEAYSRFREGLREWDEIAGEGL